MASIFGWMHNRQRKREAAYEQRFLGKLAGATTGAEAIRVCRDEFPHPGGVGRLRHTNLLAFLSGFAPGPHGTLRVLRDQPLIPSQSTPNEREAYIGFARRISAAGELSTEDLAFIEQCCASDARGATHAPGPTDSDKEG